MTLQQSREEVTVEPVQTVDRVPNAKARMQIKEQMSVSERPGEIKEHRTLLSMRAKLHAKIYGDGCGAHAPLGTHDGDQLIRGSSRRLCVLVEARQNLIQGIGGDRLCDKILHTTSHGVQQQLRIWRIRRRTGESAATERPHPPQVSAECKVNFRITREIQKDDIRDDFSRIRHFLRGHNPLFNGGTDKSRLLQAGRQVRRAAWVAGYDRCR